MPYFLAAWASGIKV